LKLTKEQLQLFDVIIASFRVALKNSVFYAEDHPIYGFSIKNFKTSLDKWFLIEDQLSLGISQDNLFINGTPIKEKDSRYSEVANYLHIRGLSALTIQKGIDLEELTDFFNVIRNDRKTIKKKGGVQENIRTAGYIKVKTVDYSALLGSAKGKVESEEEKIWKFLFDTAKEAKVGDLPESKVEFLIDFLSDTNKSAMTLNRVYKEAVNKLQDETVADEIRDTIMKICQYFEKESGTKSREIKVKLMNVIGQLDSDLVNILFESTVEEEKDFDLVEAITKDFSESYIAEFIGSLLSHEDTFNENLLKLFDKLAPDSEKANNVVSMVADRLFSQRIVNPDTLSKLQMAIKDIFNRHPESNFMNQIYKITVDAVINKKIDTLVYMAKLTPLINKFVQSVEEGELKKEELWLLLNILWLENEADEFKKFTEKVLVILPEFLDTKDTKRVKEIVEFFAEKPRIEQKQDKNMIREIKDGLKKVTNNETVNGIISMIPEASKKDLDDIGYILRKAGSRSPKLLVNAFLEDKNPAHRDKFRLIFFMMKDAISNEVVERFEYCEPYHVRDLLLILKECTPGKAHLMSKKLMSYKNAQIRLEALEGFIPKNQREMYSVFKLFKNEKNMGVKKKAAIVLLNTKNKELINKIFKYTRSSFLRRKFLLQLIDLCGQLRVQESFMHLRNIFLKWSIFNTRKRDDLRVSVLTSLARLHSDEAMKLVKNGLHDRSKRVREMSEIVMELEN